MDDIPFPQWLLKKARANPTNPVYAHLQARVALEGIPSLPLPPAPAVEDQKSKAAGEKHREIREDDEAPGFPEECEIIEGEE